MSRKGFSARQAANELGTTRGAVLGKAHRMGIGVNPKARAVDKQYRERVYFADLDTGTADEWGCQWPIGDPGEPGFHFCEAERVTGKSYCAEHNKIAYTGRSVKAESLVG